MTENDLTDSARTVKTGKGGDSSPKTGRRRKVGIGLQSGRVAPRSRIERGLGISRKTLDRWRAAGLPVYDGLGTAEALIITDDVIAFIRSKPELPKSYREELAERKSARKKRK